MIARMILQGLAAAAAIAASAALYAAAAEERPEIAPQVDQGQRGEWRAADRQQSGANGYIVPPTGTWSGDDDESDHEHRFGENRRDVHGDRHRSRDHDDD